MEIPGAIIPVMAEPSAPPNNKGASFICIRISSHLAAPSRDWKKYHSYLAPDEKIDFSSFHILSISLSASFRSSLERVIKLRTP